jgi:ATP-binding cassette subfamily G (WHITE) protein 2
MQDDALQSVMTVRENLWFSANLRLPSSLSRKQKNQKIESVWLVVGVTLGACLVSLFDLLVGVVCLFVCLFVCGCIYDLSHSLEFV